MFDGEVNNTVLLMTRLCTNRWLLLKKHEETPLSVKWELVAVCSLVASQ